jgi:transglutaminase-like putative cysteine protease
MVDSSHPAVVAFAAQHAGTGTPRERAVALYYAVRDRIRYDPYNVALTEQSFRASTTLASGRAWCVPKAILLAAVCRAQGIPARLGYADVRNHLSTARMRQEMQNDLFVWHGYTDIWLDGVWVKATPAFNLELTQKFGMLPLEFDGREDSIYHPFDASGNRHMEYVLQRGTYLECPIQAMRVTFAQAYPNASWIKRGDSADAPNLGGTMAQSSFEADVELEAAGGAAGTSRVTTG